MGRPAGSLNKDKPFREALRMELAAAGDDLKSLRKIAEALISKAQGGDVQAIKEVADRLDGKPPQEATVTVDDKRDATDWSKSELVAFLNDAAKGRAGTTAPDRGAKRFDSVH